MAKYAEENDEIAPSTRRSFITQPTNLVVKLRVPKKFKTTMQHEKNLMKTATPVFGKGAQPKFVVPTTHQPVNVSQTQSEEKNEDEELSTRTRPTFVTRPTNLVIKLKVPKKHKTTTPRILDTTTLEPVSINWNVQPVTHERFTPLELTNAPIDLPFEESSSSKVSIMGDITPSEKVSTNKLEVTSIIIDHDTDEPDYENDEYSKNQIEDEWFLKTSSNKEETPQLVTTSAVETSTWASISQAFESPEVISQLSTITDQNKITYKVTLQGEDVMENLAAVEPNASSTLKHILINETTASDEFGAVVTIALDDLAEASTEIALLTTHLLPSITSAGEGISKSETPSIVMETQTVSIRTSANGIINSSFKPFEGETSLFDLEVETPITPLNIVALTPLLTKYVIPTSEMPIFNLPLDLSISVQPQTVEISSQVEENFGITSLGITEIPNLQLAITTENLDNIFSLPSIGPQFPLAEPNFTLDSQLSIATLLPASIEALTISSNEPEVLQLSAATSELNQLTKTLQVAESSAGLQFSSEVPPALEISSGGISEPIYTSAETYSVGLEAQTVSSNIVTLFSETSELTQPSAELTQPPIESITNILNPQTVSIGSELFQSMTSEVIPLTGFHLEEVTSSTTSGALTLTTEATFNPEAALTTKAPLILTSSTPFEITSSETIQASSEFSENTSKASPITPEPVSDTIYSSEITEGLTLSTGATTLGLVTAPETIQVPSESLSNLEKISEVSYSPESMVIPEGLVPLIITLPEEATLETVELFSENGTDSLKTLLTITTTEKAFSLLMISVLENVTLPEAAAKTSELSSEIAPEVSSAVSQFQSENVAVVSPTETPSISNELHSPPNGIPSTVYGTSAQSPIGVITLSMATTPETLHFSSKLSLRTNENVATISSEPSSSVELPSSTEPFQASSMEGSQLVSMTKSPEELHKVKSSLSDKNLFLQTQTGEDLTTINITIAEEDVLELAYHGLQADKLVDKLVDEDETFETSSKIPQKTTSNVEQSSSEVNKHTEVTTALSTKMTEELKHTESSHSSLISNKVPPQEMHKHKKITDSGITTKKALQENVDEELKHFQGHETSTLCETCNATETIGIPTTIKLPKSSRPLSTSVPHKHTEVIESRISSAKPQEEVMDEQLKHFPGVEESTLCEHCNATEPVASANILHSSVTQEMNHFSDYKQSTSMANVGESYTSLPKSSEEVSVEEPKHFTGRKNTSSTENVNAAETMKLPGAGTQNTHITAASKESSNSEKTIMIDTWETNRTILTIELTKPVELSSEATFHQLENSFPENISFTATVGGMFTSKTYLENTPSEQFSLSEDNANGTVFAGKAIITVTINEEQHVTASAWSHEESSGEVRTEATIQQTKYSSSHEGTTKEAAGEATNGSGQSPAHEGSPVPSLAEITGQATSGEEEHSSSHKGSTKESAGEATNESGQSRPHGGSAITSVGEITAQATSEDKEHSLFHEGSTKESVGEVTSQSRQPEAHEGLSPTFVGEITTPATSGEKEYSLSHEGSTKESVGEATNESGKSQEGSAVTSVGEITGQTTFGEKKHEGSTLKSAGEATNASGQSQAHEGSAVTSVGEITGQTSFGEKKHESSTLESASEATNEGGQFQAHGGSAVTSIEEITGQATSMEKEHSLSHEISTNKPAGEVTNESGQYPSHGGSSITSVSEITGQATSGEKEHSPPHEGSTRESVGEATNESGQSLAHEGSAVTSGGEITGKATSGEKEHLPSQEGSTKKSAGEATNESGQSQVHQGSSITSVGEITGQETSGEKEHSPPYEHSTTKESVGQATSESGQSPTHEGSTTTPFGEITGQETSGKKEHSPSHEGSTKESVGEATSESGRSPTHEGSTTTSFGEITGQETSGEKEHSPSYEHSTTKESVGQARSESGQSPTHEGSTTTSFGEITGQETSGKKEHSPSLGGSTTKESVGEATSESGQSSAHEGSTTTSVGEITGQETSEEKEHLPSHEGATKQSAGEATNESMQSEAHGSSVVTSVGEITAQATSGEKDHSLSHEGATTESAGVATNENRQSQTHEGSAITSIGITGQVTSEEKEHSASYEGSTKESAGEVTNESGQSKANEGSVVTSVGEITIEATSGEKEISPSHEGLTKESTGEATNEESKDLSTLESGDVSASNELSTENPEASLHLLLTSQMTSHSAPHEVSVSDHISLPTDETDLSNSAKKQMKTSQNPEEPHSHNPAEVSLTSESYNGTSLTPIYISLPIYPKNSTASIISFEKYYSSTTVSTTVVDDEANDCVLNKNAFRTMKLEDFKVITEFPPTTTSTEMGGTCSSFGKTLETTSTRFIEGQASDIAQLGQKEKGTSVLAEEETSSAYAAHSGYSSQNEMESSEYSNFSSEHMVLNGTSGIPSENVAISSASERSSSASSTLAHSASLKVTLSQPYVSEYPKIQEESTCKLSDFESHNHCICSVDNLVKDLRIKFSHSLPEVNMDNYSCPILSLIETGVILGNSSIPQVAKSRRNMMGSTITKREIIDNPNIDKTLNEQLELKGGEHEIFATPGMKVRIPCMLSSGKDVPQNIVNYTWTFADGLPLTEGKVQESEGALTIEYIAAQDGGNYTCTVTSGSGDTKTHNKFEHHLSVVSLPTYTISTTILYNSTEKCQSGDADILSLYFPNVLGSLICGNYFQVCTVEVKDAQCVNKSEDYIYANLSTLIEPMNVIMPTLNTSVCDVSCEMKIYTRIVLFVIKNLETIEKLPVFFRLAYRQQKLAPTELIVQKSRDEIGTEAPKLIVACPPGFGYHKKSHICGACERNKFSRGDETFCTACPAGQYQPMVGSKSCLVCSSPLDDPYCLRVVYSNTHKFRIVIGVAASTLVLVVILILFLRSSKKSTSSPNAKLGRDEYLKSKRHSKRKHRDFDVEKQDDTEPLLSDKHRSRKYKHSKKPPEPPPPDFL